MQPPSPRRWCHQADGPCAAGVHAAGGPTRSHGRRRFTGGQTQPADGAADRRRNVSEVGGVRITWRGPAGSLGGGRRGHLAGAGGAFLKKLPMLACALLAAAGAAFLSPPRAGAGAGLSALAAGAARVDGAGGDGALTCRGASAKSITP